MVANDVSKKETGFNVDYNKISIIERNGKIEKTKFCIKFVVINFEEDSKKIIDKKPKK